MTTQLAPQTESQIDLVELEGSPSQRGSTLGKIAPTLVQKKFKEYWGKEHSFETSYFRKNFAFMKQEFPELMEEMEAFGEAAGLTPEETYFTHILSTGNSSCSAFAILTLRKGPIMLRTMDPSKLEELPYHRKHTRVVIQRGLMPHAYASVGTCSSIVPSTAVNDAGFAVGGASAHPKFNFKDNPETINIYWWFRILAQYCTDCADARRLVKQYRSSGLKGQTNVVMDAKGNALGIELESENVAFREPKGGILLEVNHFQHPDLEKPGRRLHPEFWNSPYFYNSMNRVMHIEHHRKRIQSMTHLKEFIDFVFEPGWPGAILQQDRRNIANWFTVHASFVQARKQQIQCHSYPLKKEHYQMISL